jgi:histidyl-tRNA synthetase
MPFLRVLSHCGGGSLKNQLKRADKSGASLALILGESEVAEGLVTFKPLRGDGPQQSVALSQVLSQLNRQLEA